MLLLFWLMGRSRMLKIFLPRCKQWASLTTLGQRRPIWSPFIQRIKARLFLAEVFATAPSPTLPALAQKRRKGGPRSASAEPSCRSARQAAIKSVVPVSQRASSRLIRQLDIAETGAPVGEVELRQLADLLHGPLAPKIIDAIRAVTRLADDQVTRAAAAMAMDELAAQAEAYTA
jgi:hypothetical protein